MNSAKASNVHYPLELIKAYLLKNSEDDEHLRLKLEKFMGFPQPVPHLLN